jgi:hypothetical protein
MDFAKAFDKVSHRHLLYKLSYYGIRGDTHRWIEGFLKDRTQRVVLEGKCSKDAPVTSGVPQGTVLGPILFLVYINDLADYLEHSRLRLFADDSIIYKEIHSDADCQLLQDDLNKTLAWEKDWLMAFHPDKCNVLSITQSRNPIRHQYKMHHHTLEQVKSTEYLGVTIQDDLHWNEHVQKSVKKSNQMLGMLRRNLWKASIRSKTLAYYTLIRPRLEYGACAWDPHNKNLTHALEMVQRRAARYVTGNYSRVPGSMTAILQQLQWQTLEERRQHQRLVMLFKIVNNLVAIRAASYLNAPGRTTRNAHEGSFMQYSCRKNTFKYSFFPRTVVDWNHLPTETVSLTDIDAFRHALSLRVGNP